jgi:hypothetical protein
MVCIAAACPAPDWHRVFRSFVPKIVRHARLAFRHLRGQDYQDAIQETVANALVAFVRLVHRGKMSLAYPTVLAKYAVAQINDGRRVGNSLNCSDVLSPYCQRLKDLTVERLDRREKDDENEWCEVLVEDKTAGPAEIACIRIDFDAWLQSLSRRDRKVAKFLSLGNRTADAAKKFNVSQGRVSQLRRELQESWNDFTGGNAA